LQRDVSGAAASALAVVQVQHEQQLMAAKQEQQELVQEAKQQVEQLQQQLRELQQQLRELQQQVGAACVGQLLDRQPLRAFRYAWSKQHQVRCHSSKPLLCIAVVRAACNCC
jgi:TolA-binding protein